MSQNVQTDSERYSTKNKRECIWHTLISYIMVFNLVSHLSVSCQLPRGSERFLISGTSFRACVAFFCLKKYSFVLRRISTVGCVIFT